MSEETDQLVVSEDGAAAEGEGEEVEEKPKGPTFGDKVKEQWRRCTNLDRIFSYDTPKTLRVLDRRLGLIDMFGRYIIWAYIIGYVLIFEGFMFNAAPGYGPVMVKVVNDTFLYAEIGATAKAKKPFTVFDSVDVVTPYLESGALFVMTQMERQPAQKMTSDGGGERRLLAASDTSKGAEGMNWSPAFGGADMLKFELQDVETLKIRFFSTVAFPALDPIGAQTFESEGGFVGNSTIQMGTNAYTIEEILATAGLTMSTVQSQGAILQVNLLWDCFLLLPEIFGKCRPNLQAVQLDTLTKDPGFSMWRTRHYVNEEGDAVRDLEKMTGIRMIWRSVGTGNQIDLFSIIFHIAAGVSLLPMAGVVVQVVMQYIVPERKHYDKNLFTETDDFYMLDDIKADKEDREKRLKEESSAVDTDALFKDDDAMEEDHGNM